MGWWRRFFNGWLSGGKSQATGLILGFMAWTLMRLVDGITELQVKFTRPDAATALPVARIKPETTQFRLVEPAFSTFVAGVPKGEAHA